MVIPVEMVGVASSVASTSSSVVQMKLEESQHGKPMPASETASVVVGSSSSGAASLPQLIPLQPQFVVQGNRPSPERTVIESDEVERKRLRVADEEWTADS